MKPRYLQEAVGAVSQEDEAAVAVWRRGAVEEEQAV